MSRLSTWAEEAVAHLLTEDRRYIPFRRAPVRVEWVRATAWMIATIPAYFVAVAITSPRVTVTGVILYALVAAGNGLILEAVADLYHLHRSQSTGAHK